MGVILRIPLDYMENVGLTRAHTHCQRTTQVKMAKDLNWLENDFVAFSVERSAASFFSRTRQSAIARKSRSPHTLITRKYIIPLYFLSYIVTHYLIRCSSSDEKTIRCNQHDHHIHEMCSGLNAVHFRPSVSCLSHFLLWISVDFFSLFAAAIIKRKSRETFSFRPNIKSVKMDPLFFLTNKLEIEVGMGEREFLLYYFEREL